jgi:hypothetical protein
LQHAATNTTLVYLILGTLLPAQQQPAQSPAPQQAKPPAQAPVIRRQYMTNIAEEDWRFLKDRSLWSDFWDPVKYIALPKENWSLSLGAEVRISPQGLRIRGDAERPSTIDNYILQRYLFGADLRMGSRFRFFTEIQSGIINGRIASPRPNDKDVLEIHQGFFEYKSPQNPKQFLLRLGRQELNIGSGRLIAPSQGLNVKRSFDGLMSAYATPNWSLEGGVARLVRIKPGIFDDPPDAEQEFWGINFARRAVPWKTSQVSFYYLGLSKKASVYVQGVGPETRHTMGARISGRWRKMDFNYDLIYQRGEFRQLPAQSWAISTDTGVAIRLWKFPARLATTFNSASGDKDPKDGRLESFNPLFPGNSYSGVVGLLGPTNLTDFTPSLRVPVRRNLVLAFEMPSYYRSSTRDGLYTIDLRLLLPGQSNRHRYVGTNPGVIAAWQMTRHVNFTGAITRFLPGAFLSDTFVKNGFGFYSIAGTYRF